MHPGVANNALGAAEKRYKPFELTGSPFVNGWEFSVEATLRKNGFLAENTVRISGVGSQKSPWAMVPDGVEVEFGLTGIKSGRNRLVKMHDKNHFLTLVSSEGERRIYELDGFQTAPAQYDLL